MHARSRFGRTGEDAAAAWLRRAGYHILDRNYRCALGEVDIVAAKDGVVAFCEVKTRRTDRFGVPAEAVTSRKQARLRRLAAHWLHERKCARVEIRLDVVSVIIRDGRAEITHLPSAF